jgi:uncharacterized protein (TIGR03435 family)
MLQALLAERFKLAAHKEERPRSGFTMVVDKGGPKFKADDPNTGRAPAGSTMFGFAGHGLLKGVMTMEMLASNLSRQGYSPVEDAGLTEKYGIELHWTPEPGNRTQSSWRDCFIDDTPRCRDSHA